MTAVTLPQWDDDEVLLADLRDALTEPGPVPPEFLDAAEASLTWRTIDDELEIAELTFDSVCDAELASRSRSDNGPRTLAFTCDEASMEIEVTSAGIVGQLTPARPGRVTAQTAAGTFDETTVDEVGCFVLQAPPSGPARLQAHTEGYRIATSWVRLG